MVGGGGVCGRGRGVHAWGHVLQGGHVWQWSVCGRGYAWQGACVAGGVHGRGHVWQATCMAGGMHGIGGVHSRGAYVVGGCVWQGEGACMVGGMNGRGVCVAEGDMCGGEHAWQIL